MCSLSEVEHRKTSLTTFLKKLIAPTLTRSEHLVIIDGLGDLLLSDPIQLQALSGLILEAAARSRRLDRLGARVHRLSS